nr:ORF [Oenothera sp.]
MPFLVGLSPPFLYFELINWALSSRALAYSNNKRKKMVAIELLPNFLGGAESQKRNQSK